MTHEGIKAADHYIREKRLKFTCGWTTKQIAWQAERSGRTWTKEHYLTTGFREWIGKHLKNESAVQTMKEEKLDDYLKTVCRPIALACNIDGLLYDKDIVRLKCAYAPKSIFLSALPLDVSKEGRFLLPTRATGSEDSGVMVKNSFQIFRSDKRIPSSVPLMYEECINICTELSTGQLMLHSEMRTYDKFAELSRNQEVCWKSDLSSRSLWKVFPRNQQCKKGSKNKYIMVNTAVILTHVVTNQNLALEVDFKISTVMGDECEISAQTFSPTGKSDPRYLWIFEAPYYNFNLRTNTKPRFEGNF